jgi:hypothetical protein
MNMSVHHTVMGRKLSRMASAEEEEGVKMIAKDKHGRSGDVA